MRTESVDAFKIFRTVPSGPEMSSNLPSTHSKWHSWDLQEGPFGLSLYISLCPLISLETPGFGLGHPLDGNSSQWSALLSLVFNSSLFMCKDHVINLLVKKNSLCVVLAKRMELTFGIPGSGRRICHFPDEWFLVNQQISSTFSFPICKRKRINSTLQACREFN